MCSFVKKYNTGMKTVKKLNIKDKPGYVFMNMANINNFDPNILVINEFTIFENSSIIFEINYCQENITLHIVFNNIDCVFRKSCVFSYLIFCETEKNRKMLKNYTKIDDEIKNQILFVVDDDIFVMCKDFMRFRFETNDKLPYYQKINVPVCVISIKSAFEEGWYYPQMIYKTVLMKVIVLMKIEY